MVVDRGDDAPKNVGVYTLYSRLAFQHNLRCQPPSQSPCERSASHLTHRIHIFARLAWSTREDRTVGGYSAAGTYGLDGAPERILIGSLTNSHKFKEDGMMKKTFSLTLPHVTKTHHLVSYYKVSDVDAGRLRMLSSLPEFVASEISPEFHGKTHFRVQPSLVPRARDNIHENALQGATSSKTTARHQV